MSAGSWCKTWFKMKEPYNTARFKAHIMAAKCKAPPPVDTTKRTLDQFQLAAQRPKPKNPPPLPIVVRPCPGLTRGFDEAVGNYLDRTVSTGGGAHAVNHYSDKIFNKEFTELTEKEKDTVYTVASYLMDFEDHFTSHTYRNFYWTSFESFINKQLNSPECYPSKNASDGSEPVNEEKRPSDNEDDGKDSEDALDEDCDDLLFLNDLADPQNPNDTVDDEQDTINVVVMNCPTYAQNPNDTVDDEQDVRVEFDGTGNLVTMGNQLADYQCRGDELSNIRKSTDRRSHKSGDGDPQDVEDDAVDVSVMSRLQAPGSAGARPRPSEQDGARWPPFD
ncbi:hypothetical protein B0H10DRAFT_2237715 [Mycena sp. CBHHK59/15]|nr:hypothetical protein B0H10DRAFT_2237715 [Mycena sp. CBHHK59/15]